MIATFYKTCSAAVLALMLLGFSAANAQPAPLNAEQKQELLRLIEQTERQTQQLNNELAQVKKVRQTQQTLQRQRDIASTIVRLTRETSSMRQSLSTER